MRYSPTVFLCLLLFSGPLLAQDPDPDYPYMEEDALSLRAAPAGRVVSPGRMLVGDFDRGRVDAQGLSIGNPSRDLAYVDEGQGTVCVTWRPGVSESLDVDIASNVTDIGLRPGGPGESDQLIVVDAQGLKLYSFVTGGWVSSLELPSWAGFRMIETYSEAGSDFQVIGVAPDLVSVYRMYWIGAVAHSELLFVSPLPVLQLKPYDRAGTSDPGVAVMADGAVALFDLAGNMLNSYSSPGWGFDSIATVRMDLGTYDWIALVVTMPWVPFTQYLISVNEVGTTAPKGIGAGRRIANIVSGHYATTGVSTLHEDLFATYEENDDPPNDDPEVLVLLNKGGVASGPDFDLATHSVELTCPRGPDPTTGYQGMATVADMDNDGDADVGYLATIGRLILFLNQRVEASEQMPVMMDFRKNVSYMAVSTDITSQVTFDIPPEVPTGSDMWIQLETFRQETRSSDTGAEPSYSSYRLHQGGSVSFGFGDDLDLDPEDGDCFGSGSLYYLAIRGVRRDPVWPHRLLEVWPGRVYGLHVSRGHTVAGELDPYLNHMAVRGSEEWLVDKWDISNGKIYGEIGRGRDLIMIPAIPYE